MTGKVTMSDKMLIKSSYLHYQINSRQMCRDKTSSYTTCSLILIVEIKFLMLTGILVVQRKLQSENCKGDIMGVNNKILIEEIKSKSARVKES